MESLILGILFCYHYIMVICMFPKVTIKLVQLLNIHLMALIRLALIFNRHSGRATTLSTKSNFGLPWIFLAEMKDLGELINIFENFQNPSVRAWWNLRSKIQKMRKNCIKGEQVWFGTARIWTRVYSSWIRRLSHHSQPATYKCNGKL